MDLSKKNDWAKYSGLLPIHLTPHNSCERYIMLDGGYQDFCIDFVDEERTTAECYSFAWSSDVKNYIKILNDNIIIHNWSRNKTDTIPRKTIEEKFPSFLKILNSTNYKTTDDIAPFIIGLFGQLRNITNEKKDPIEALNLLFKLLVSIDENSLNNEIIKQWKIENVSTPSNFEEIVGLLRNGIHQIKPNLDLILRHGSGLLFEIAHREVLSFDMQLDLFSGISSNNILRSVPNYSSIHYTPRFLVRSIVENSLKFIDLKTSSLRIFDPACGSGAFLLETVKQLKELQYKGKIEVIGFDISPLATKTSEFLLSYEQRTQWNEQDFSICIKQCNSLLEEWETCDLILMNPPFVSFELLKDNSTKEAAYSILKELDIKKRPNIAAAFIYKATKALKNDGVLGSVIPTSILLQDQYIPLRNVMCELSTPRVVAQLGNFVFENALTNTSFIILNKTYQNAYRPLTIWCNNNEKSAFESMRGWRIMQSDKQVQKVESNYNIYKPSRFPLIKNTWGTTPFSNDLFINKIEERVNNGDLKKLSDIFVVKQGVIKGSKDLFEITIEQFDSLTKAEKKLFRPIASSQTIKYGQVIKGNYLWFPYDKNGLIIKTEEQLRKFTWAYDWLMANKNILENRKGISHWWELTRPRNWQFVPNKCLCSKRFGNSSSFAITTKHHVIEEGNAFFFKKETNSCEDDMYFYLAFFSSSIFDHLLSIYAHPIMAGYDLGNIHIKDIPIVDVSNDGIRSTEAYQKLVSFAKTYSEGQSGLKDVFDRFIKSFYPSYE